LPAAAATARRESKEFPSAGKEHPRRRPNQKVVTVLMRKISEQTIGRTTGALRWLPGFMGRTGGAAGFLLLALLLNPIPGFSALPSGASLTLAWDRSPSLEVTGYRVYYGGASQNYSNSVVLGNVTSNTISGLAIGGTYFFAVTAYNSIGLESPRSNEINVTIPGGLAKLQISVAANKQALLTVTGQIGHTYEIQATPDLKAWTVLGTVTLGASGVANFTNTNAGSFAERFYRTRDTQP
jgi:hypothetical protein